MTNKFTHERRRASSPHPHPVYIWAAIFSCLSHLPPVLAHTPGMPYTCYEAPAMVTGNVWVLFSSWTPTPGSAQVADIMCHPRANILPPNYFRLLLYFLVHCNPPPGLVSQYSDCGSTSTDRLSLQHRATIHAPTGCLLRPRR